MYNFLVGLLTGFIAFTDEGKQLSNKAFNSITGIIKSTISQKTETEKTKDEETGKEDK